MRRAHRPGVRCEKVNLACCDHGRERDAGIGFLPYSIGQAIDPSQHLGRCHRTCGPKQIYPVPRCASPIQEAVYQSSQPSSLPFGAVEPPPPLFLMVLVPNPLGFDVSSAGAPKLSQKSFLAGSAFLPPGGLPSWPSTNLLIDSAAPLAPD